VVVVGGGLVAAVLGFLHPRQERREPVADAAVVLRAPRLAARNQPDGVDDAREAARFDQSDTAAGVHARNELRVLEVRRHPRGGIEEERAQQRRRLLGVPLVAAEVVRKSKGRRIRHETVDGLVVRDPVDLGVADAVLPDVRPPVRASRIRPEVRRLAHVVVLVAARRRHGLVDDREPRDGQRLLRVGAQGVPRGGEGWIFAGNGRLRGGQACGIEQEDPGWV
jgi:hypothetical protein